MLLGETLEGFCKFPLMPQTTLHQHPSFINSFYENHTHQQLLWETFVNNYNMELQSQIPIKTPYQHL